MSPNLQNNHNSQSRHRGTDLSNGNVKGFQSSFPGVIYSGPRGEPFPNIFDWLQGIN